MESVNYTYEAEDISAAVTIIRQYRIIDKSGNVIAITYKEDSAELIVAALNGVAP